MAAPGDKSSPQSTPQDENPFVTFRRFADEQVSSLFRSIIGKRSAPTSQMTDPQWQAFDKVRRSQEYEGRSPSDEDGWERLKSRQGNSQDKAVEIPVKKYAEDVEFSRNDDQVMRCPYRPADQEVPERNRLLRQPPTFEYLNPFDELSCEENIREGFPRDFMEQSPYSPLRLELEHMEDAPKWRNAFEDLMALQQGKAMPTRRIREAESDMSEWVASMLDMGLFGGWSSQSRWCPGLGLISAIRYPEMDTDEEEEEEEEEETELDIYEQTRRLMTRLSIPPTAPNVESSEDSAKPQAATEAPSESIMSTLTTTERRTLPDGTVHTKVVLKRRFTDGSEESTETVHTVKGSQDRPQSVSQVAKDGFEKERQRSVQQSKDEGRQGWFWS